MYHHIEGMDLLVPAVVEPGIYRTVLQPKDLLLELEYQIILIHLLIKDQVRCHNLLQGLLDLKTVSDPLWATNKKRIQQLLNQSQ